MTKLENGLTCEQREHPVWKEWTSIPHDSDYQRNPIIGQFQYIYTSNKGKISLIELPNYFHDGIDLWEIYSLEGNLFEDCERFNSKEESEVRIKELLE